MLARTQIFNPERSLINQSHFLLKSLGSYEQSPRLTDQYQDYMGSDDHAISIMPVDTQLREDLADAMRESPRDSGKFDRICSEFSYFKTSFKQSYTVLHYYHLLLIS